MNKRIISIVILGLIIYGLYLIVFNNINSNKEKTFVLKEYDLNRKLVGTNEFVIRNGDTITHGKFVNYNKKGNKISEGQFVNGDVFGKCIYYFDNGNIEVSCFKKTGEIILEAIWNYPNGKIKKYEMYADFGELIFSVNYDKKQVPYSATGIPQLEIYQHKINIKTHQQKQIKNSFKIGDTLKYSYLVANIPNGKRSFIIENVGIDNTKLKRTIKHILPCQIDIEEVLNKKGKNTIRSIVQYKFNDKVTPDFTNTLTFDINVN